MNDPAKQVPWMLLLIFWALLGSCLKASEIHEDLKQIHEDLSHLSWEIHQK